MYQARYLLAIMDLDGDRQVEPKEIMAAFKQVRQGGMEP